MQGPQKDSLCGGLIEGMRALFACTRALRHCRSGAYVSSGLVDPRDSHTQRWGSTAMLLLPGKITSQGQHRRALTPAQITARGGNATALVPVEMTSPLTAAQLRLSGTAAACAQPAHW